MTWPENCVLTSKTIRGADPDAVGAVNNPTNVIFQITDTKLCEPVVTLSTEDDNILLERLKSGFKRTI